MKPVEEVITEFNERVNMTVDELEKWMDGDMSEKAGTGVGQESGRKIIEILKKNPGMDPDAYEEEDLEHMRKVVGYIGRHLAQEDHLKETKTREELEKTKSTISLKNWGHDPIKVMDERSAHAKDKRDIGVITERKGEETEKNSSDQKKDVSAKKDAADVDAEEDDCQQERPGEKEADKSGPKQAKAPVKRKKAAKAHNGDEAKQEGRVRSENDEDAPAREDGQEEKVREEKEEPPKKRTKKDGNDE